MAGLCSCHSISLSPAKAKRLFSFTVLLSRLFHAVYGYVVCHAAYKNRMARRNSQEQHMPYGNIQYWQQPRRTLRKAPRLCLFIVFGDGCCYNVIHVTMPVAAARLCLSLTIIVMPVYYQSKVVIVTLLSRCYEHVAIAFIVVAAILPTCCRFTATVCFTPVSYIMPPMHGETRVLAAAEESAYASRPERKYVGTAKWRHGGNKRATRGENKMEGVTE